LIESGDKPRKTRKRIEHMIILMSHAVAMDPTPKL